MLPLLLGTLLSAAGATPAVDPSEQFPGGAGSTSDFSVQAFSHPHAGVRGDERRQFAVGNSFFNLAWVSAPSSTTARDGLGPNFNAVACAACHFKDGRGAGLPEYEGATQVSLLFRLRLKTALGPIPHPAYGGQLQPVGIEGVPGEGRTHVAYERIELRYDDGLLATLMKPVYRFVELAFGPLGDTIASPRVAPQLIGLGLVQSISERDILKNEDPYDADGDGISGRANRVASAEHGDVRLGRFGWKAGKASLLEQNAAAFNGDMGITSPLFPEEECTEVQTECLRAKSPEDIPRERLDSVTTYTELLAVPQRRNADAPGVLAGRAVFHRINCTSCHTPSFTTSPDAGRPVLASQKIWPYSDFLLHDMGDALADDVEDLPNEDLASTREWRTPPLWGLGLVPTVNGHSRYLHDGRARSLEEAILWHGGEAAAAQRAFMALPRTERDHLLQFLNSL